MNHDVRRLLLSIALLAPLLAGCAAHRSSSSSIEIVPRPRSIAEVYDKRPRAWCGWWLRRQVNGDPGPAYNRARAWASFGDPAPGPAAGVIVVFPRGRRGGHVGIIVGPAERGLWLVRSGNDGHMVRTRARSVANAIAFRWPR